MKRCVIDIETNSLLESGLSYESMPYKLKPDYRIWCIVLRDIDDYSTKTFRQEECTKENLKQALEDVDLICGHNIVNFDLPVLKLLGILDYTVAYPGQVSTIFNKKCQIMDTLIWSRLLNPDRYDGQKNPHSLAAWGKRLGSEKIDFHEFDKYSEEMVSYCEQDTNVNVRLFHHLQNEIAESKANWDKPYSMEAKLVDITLRQSVFGFYFDTKLAAENLKFLDAEMARIRNLINPLLPPKKLNKGEQKFYQWPSKPYKANGDLSAAMQTFATRLGAKLTLPMPLMGQEATLEFEGTIYKVAEQLPLKTSIKSDIDDLDNLKVYLMSLGWQPSEYKERDLLKKPDKTKKTKQEIQETIERYTKQTFDGYFAKERCEILDIDCNEDSLKEFLVEKCKKGKPCWVPTSPKVLIGLEKNICPGIEKLGEQADFVKDLAKYLTYKHRRNSILGGNLEYDPESDEEIEKGYLAYVRSDGRIPTPANTLGANTGRYRHSIVVNVPRCTSLYGAEMRALFCCGEGFYQLGYDFASLEGRITGHYCLPYTDGKLLADAMLAEKPNDIHSSLSKKIGIPRPLAKSCYYGVLYGAQPKKIAKMVGCSLNRAEEIYNDFWKAVPALKELKDKIEKSWETNSKKYIKGLDGRLLATRSKHSLVNIVFQSGGAIFVKWSIVRICQIMEDEGILGDPFIDNETAIKVFQMIVNHDESQMAVNPKLLHIKVFKDDKTATQALVPGCSEIGHGTKGPYIAYETLPIICINKGIQIAKNELSMRVEMGINYSTGINWKQTH